MKLNGYKRKLRRATLLLAAFALAGQACADDVFDDEMEITFPTEVAGAHGETPIRLMLTGVDVRRKYFVDVYWIAHYMERPPRGDRASVIKTVLTDALMKQITMQFARDVKAEQIQRALSDGLEKNATGGEQNEIAAIVKQFAQAIKQDVATYDKFVLHWLAGGRILASYHGQVIFDVASPVFARILWSIWFGERSIVEPRALVNRLTTDS